MCGQRGREAAQRVPRPEEYHRLRGACMLRHSNVTFFEEADTTGRNLGAKNQFLLLFSACSLYSSIDTGIDDLCDHRSDYLVQAQHLHIM